MQPRGGGGIIVSLIVFNICYKQKPYVAYITLCPVKAMLAFLYPSLKCSFVLRRLYRESPTRLNEVTFFAERRTFHFS